MLNIDHTLFIQIINFLLLLFILNIILYKPIRKIVGRRKDEMHSFQTMIEDFQNESNKDATQLEENLTAARDKGQKERENLRNVGLEEEKRLLQEATSTAEDKVGQAREDIDRMAVHARQSLENEIKVFSQELAEKILGRSI